MGCDDKHEPTSEFHKDVTPDEPDGEMTELYDWWADQATAESMGAIPKAREYGSRDLMEMGGTLMRIAGQEVDDGAAVEVGCWFYAVGKMARWTAAIERGELVSDDTLHDLSVYIKMVQRVRACGGWPNG